MNLTEMFYGTFVPPENAASRVHRIGFSNGTRYEPPKKRAYDPKSPVHERLPSSAKILFQMMKKQTDYVSALQIYKKTKWTKNHCSIIMAELFKHGMLERYKIRQNKTQIYVYKVKAQYAE